MTSGDAVHGSPKISRKIGDVIYGSSLRRITEFVFEMGAESSGRRNGTNRIEMWIELKYWRLRIELSET